jgi:hypothetical protein
MRAIVVLAASAAVLITAAAPVSAGRVSTPDAQLLATYEPVLQFDPLERFGPTKVESFLTNASLEQSIAPDTWSVVRQNAAPGDLPGPGSSTWRLDQNGCTPAAALGGLDCYAAANDQGGGGPTVYGRVAREDGDIILQYWLFYYDDVYSYTYPPSDLLWQAHEGDWEDVNIVLSADEQPLYVGYSQHCLGERRAWDDTTRAGDTHPIVHVAVGSHANYFDAGTHAINVACIPGQAIAVLQALHLSLPVDYAFAGPTVGPPGTSDQRMPIEQIGDGGPAWVEFPGSWGEFQYFHAPAPIGTVAFGSSPVGPAFHAEWADPLGTLATWPES